MKDSNVDEAVAVYYAKKIGVSLEKAKEALVVRYKKEAEEIDPREISLKCIKAMRQMSPKLNGLEMREQDLILKNKELEGKINSLQQQLKIQEDILKKSITLIGTQIKNLQKKPEPNKSLLTRVSDKIKGFLFK